MRIMKKKKKKSCTKDKTFICLSNFSITFRTTKLIVCTFSLVEGDAKCWKWGNFFRCAAALCENQKIFYFFFSLAVHFCDLRMKNHNKEKRKIFHNFIFPQSLNFSCISCSLPTEQSERALSECIRIVDCIIGSMASTRKKKYLSLHFSEERRRENKQANERKESLCSAIASWKIIYEAWHTRDQLMSVLAERVHANFQCATTIFFHSFISVICWVNAPVILLSAEK